MKSERIQKIMAENGVCSRRAAETLITEGKVTVNGRPIKLGDKMDPARDVLHVDGRQIRLSRKREHVYIMVYKPRGVVTTAKDELGRKTVLELLDGVSARVFPVGRLDKDSEGLLLLTNDGELTNILTHPRHEIAKTYRTTVRPGATETQIAQLASGVVLDGGEKTQPAGVRVVDDGEGRTVMEITIREGKNRQIRRMCEAVGLTVIRLKRNSLGPLRLGMLQPGHWRNLTPAEVSALKGSAAKAMRNKKSR